jgi:hypothetical protein
MDHPRPNLRYVDADDVDDKTIKFDGLEVDSTGGDKLGKLEGFIIDVATGRPYHIVVGSGGWLKHKHFLLPVGHVSLSSDSTKVVADITKDRVERYPGFDKDEFETLSDDDLGRMTDTISTACCPDEVVTPDVSVWDTTHYAYPTWWDADYYRPDRADRSARDIAGTAGLSGANMPPRTATTRQNDAAREAIRASETTSDTAGETSPHLGGRAQPGDVLGVETGGERTYVGDTSEDENKRRRDAEEAARKTK